MQVGRAEHGEADDLAVGAGAAARGGGGRAGCGDGRDAGSTDGCHGEQLPAGGG